MPKLTKIIFPEVGVGDLKIRPRGDNRCESANVLGVSKTLLEPLLVSFMLANYGSQATTRYSGFVTTGLPRLALDASCALKKKFEKQLTVWKPILAAQMASCETFNLRTCCTS